MLVATFAGRRINRAIGERGYTSLFWAVMAGYTARLVLTL
jgi:ankyrin repeat protein